MDIIHAAPLDQRQIVWIMIHIWCYIWIMIHNFCLWSSGAAWIISVLVGVVCVIHTYFQLPHHLGV